MDSSDLLMTEGSVSDKFGDKPMPLDWCPFYLIKHYCPVDTTSADSAHLQTSGKIQNQQRREKLALFIGSFGPGYALG